jgi:hypothetical protein
VELKVRRLRGERGKKVQGLFWSSSSVAITRQLKGASRSLSAKPVEGEVDESEREKKGRQTAPPKKAARALVRAAHGHLQRGHKRLGSHLPRRVRCIFIRPYITRPTARSRELILD